MRYDRRLNRGYPEAAFSKPAPAPNSLSNGGTGYSGNPSQGVPRNKDVKRHDGR